MESFEGKVAVGQQAQQSARTANDRVKSLNDELAQLKEDAAAQKNAYEGEIAGLQNDLATAKSQAISAEGQLQVKEAQLQQVSAGFEQQSAIIATMRSELDKARTDTLRNQKRNTELTDQNQTLSTELETAVEQVRLLKEKLADLENQLTRGGAVASRNEAVGPTAGSVNVRGVVTGVQTVADDVFVSVNVGSNDRVAEGMEFMIHDGGNFIGTLVISQVDLNSSAGRVTLATGEIRPNLQVLAANF